MWRKKSVITTIGITLLFTMVLVVTAFSQEGYKLPCPPDKKFCALMIRLGNEAYERGKYLEARKYYRMAIASDPSSARGWALYDRSFLAHMAYQVERTGKFIPFVPTDDIKKMFMAVPPGAPVDSEPVKIPSAPQPPTDTPAGEEQLEGVIIGDDEGC
ncbi:MAG: hypothetical protein K8S13_01670 [Desulfobacula sp.]|uniref:tetratricopeptide repeat protein n=1 Tax=Desulfobacula sp. TaxID=2593537 RepID=UPI0025BA7006|nr:tetratricopeptide repeat protein [Desulfobacula sp.]MCD4718557.1 hypothetical protein [Desulfobacula sp.]